MKFDAFAIAHAGPVEPTFAAGPKSPLLLLTADEDMSIVSMMRFDSELSKEEWPHAIVTRDGGHGLTDSDIAMALEFFLRSQHESLPLLPALSTRVPKPNLPDAETTNDTAAAVDPLSPNSALAPTDDASAN